MAVSSSVSELFRGRPRAARWHPAGPGRLLPAALLVLVVAAPVLQLAAYVGQPDEGLWAHLAATTLLGHLRDTALLVLGVALGTAVVGAGTAWLVTLYRFPGRRILNWALVLPLAMPTYVLAYAWTDLLQVTGPVQRALRALTGLSVQELWFPEIRSLGGAIFVLTFALYPYVYLLCRAAFLEQSQCALEVSRTLGCGAGEAFRRVGLPLARPALVAGLAFVVMETMADFGAVKHFEVGTLTTAIYRAWYALGSPVVAAQLALLLLAAVFATLAVERWARGRARFATGTVHIFRKRRVPLGPASQGLLACPGLRPARAVGFVLPVAGLLAMASGEQHELTPRPAARAHRQHPPARPLREPARGRRGPLRRLPRRPRPQRARRSLGPPRHLGLRRAGGGGRRRASSSSWARSTADARRASSASSSARGCPGC
jgi:iron(III) transport system permease protein